MSLSDVLAAFDDAELHARVDVLDRLARFAGLDRR